MYLGSFNFKKKYYDSQNEGSNFDFWAHIAKNDHSALKDDKFDCISLQYLRQPFIVCLQNMYLSVKMIKNEIGNQMKKNDNLVIILLLKILLPIKNMI